MEALADHLPALHDDSPDEGVRTGHAARLRRKLDGPLQVPRISLRAQRLSHFGQSSIES
jgi:hypothetical protein